MIKKIGHSREGMAFLFNVDNEKVGIAEQLFSNNLLVLSQLIEKRTYPSRVFWSSVAELFEKGRWEKLIPLQAGSLSACTD